MEKSFQRSVDIPQCLCISDEQISALMNKVTGIERSNQTDNAHLASFKYCPTRHGCTGATNCDYEYGAPVGR